VLNRGYDPVKNKWNESEGKAYFTGEPTTAALKVSFFGPFYGGYNVIKLDDKYQYALVSGPNRDYLWILSRTPTIPEAVKQDYLNTARDLGFRVDQLCGLNIDLLIRKRNARQGVSRAGDQLSGSDVLRLERQR
uniref:lipocalin family protein n=1 Tax=Enterobacter hormaechei TaxID=158836 RepID=UPI00255022BB